MLPRSYTRAMARKAASFLIATGAVECSDTEVLARIVEKALVDELTVEARLREEARRLISAHKGEVRAEGADVDALREKIVAKLARERGLVLR